MKKAIKKTCVVLLLFALLVSQVAASYSETGTLNEGTSAISAAERYHMYWGKHVTYIFFDQFQMCSLWLCSDIYNPNFTYTYGEEYANYTYCTN